MKPSVPDFDAVVEQGNALQERLDDGGLVAVGGTAAALHCGHRFSLDVDFVTPQMRERYEGFLERLETWPGWQTNRRTAPVLILGERAGIELGVRQLRHRDRLETERVQGLRVPTAAEMLRIKAFLLAERRATRDYLDVAALSRKLGFEESLRALACLSDLYPALGRVTAATAFAEACEAAPADRHLVELTSYRGLRAPFTQWDEVAATVQKLGRAVLKRELSGQAGKSNP
jgi:hypothetical protein